MSLRKLYIKKFYLRIKKSFWLEILEYSILKQI